MVIFAATPCFAFDFQFLRMFPVSCVLRFDLLDCCSAYLCRLAFTLTADSKRGEKKASGGGNADTKSEGTSEAGTEDGMLERAKQEKEEEDNFINKLKAEFDAADGDWSAADLKRCDALFLLESQS